MYVNIYFIISYHSNMFKHVRRSHDFWQLTIIGMHLAKQNPYSKFVLILVIFWRYCLFGQKTAELLSRSEGKDSLMMNLTADFLSVKPFRKTKNKDINRKNQTHLKKTFNIPSNFQAATDSYVSIMFYHVCERS